MAGGDRERALSGAASSVSSTVPSMAASFTAAARCRNNCSDSGVCVDGVCECLPRRFGRDCSLAVPSADAYRERSFGRDVQSGGKIDSGYTYAELGDPATSQSYGALGIVLFVMCCLTVSRCACRRAYEHESRRSADSTHRHARDDSCAHADGTSIAWRTSRLSDRSNQPTASVRGLVDRDSRSGWSRLSNRTRR